MVCARSCVCCAPRACCGKRRATPIVRPCPLRLTCSCFFYLFIYFVSCFSFLLLGERRGGRQNSVCELRRLTLAFVSPVCTTGCLVCGVDSSHLHAECFRMRQWPGASYTLVLWTLKRGLLSEGTPLKNRRINLLFLFCARQSACTGLSFL